IGEAHRRIDDRQKHNAIEMDSVFVPVVGKTVEHDAVLRHPLGKFVGASTHPVCAEIAACLCGLRRHDHAGTIGQLREERCERADSTSLTLWSSMTSMLVTALISALRFEPGKFK